MKWHHSEQSEPHEQNEQRRRAARWKRTCSRNPTRTEPRGTSSTLGMTKRIAHRLPYDSCKDMSFSKSGVEKMDRRVESPGSMKHKSCFYLLSRRFNASLAHPTQKKHPLRHNPSAIFFGSASCDSWNMLVQQETGSIQMQLPLREQDDLQ